MNQFEMQQAIQRFTGLFLNRIMDASAPLLENATDPRIQQEALNRVSLYYSAALDVASGAATGGQRARHGRVRDPESHRARAPLEAAGLRALHRSCDRGLSEVGSGSVAAHLHDPRRRTKGDAQGRDQRLAREAPERGPSGDRALRGVFGARGRSGRGYGQEGAGLAGQRAAARRSSRTRRSCSASERCSSPIACRSSFAFRRASAPKRSWATRFAERGEITDLLEQLPNPEPIIQDLTKLTVESRGLLHDARRRGRIGEATPRRSEASTAAIDSTNRLANTSLALVREIHAIKPSRSRRPGREPRGPGRSHGAPLHRLPRAARRGAAASSGRGTTSSSAPPRSRAWRDSAAETGAHSG